MSSKTGDKAFSAWSPGLASEIPDRLKPLITMFRPENASINYAQAKELAGFAGGHENNYVAFRFERLIIHELLVRVTADLSVPDGNNYEILGINLRGMVAIIFDKYVQSDLADLEAQFTTMQKEAGEYTTAQLDLIIFNTLQKSSEVEKQPNFLTRIFGARKLKVTKLVDVELPEMKALEYWREKLQTTDNELHCACLDGLIKIVGRLIGQRGRLYADSAFITRFVVNHASNTYGSEMLGAAITSHFQVAIAAENYRVLPVQKEPVVMNTKGSSASGKSTIRPQQRILAKKLGIPWEDFALISPDYWRKYLLEYESLGEDHKYGAMLTGQELEIIDKKLDRYMAQKAADGKMSHLLIDRFRFDSFNLDQGSSNDSKLLTRFGHHVFMFFMITPPAETVKRAWARGKTTGRYKAVDDLLFHNIEAFTGIPELFFSWVLSQEKKVHFEFLDNDVPKGQRPNTIAFGWNSKITILDIKCMIDIERFKKVNVEAKSQKEVFENSSMDAEDNLGFLLRCVSQIPEIMFADQSSGYTYAVIEDGELVWCDHEYISKRKDTELFFQIFDDHQTEERRDALQVDVEKEKQFTFGNWLSKTV